jgi:hypothetical protein
MIQGSGEKVKALRAAKGGWEGVKNEVVEVDKSP